MEPTPALQMMAKDFCHSVQQADRLTYRRIRWRHYSGTRVPDFELEPSRVSHKRCSTGTIPASPKHTHRCSIEQRLHLHEPVLVNRFLSGNRTHCTIDKPINIGTEKPDASVEIEDVSTTGMEAAEAMLAELFASRC